MKIKHFNTLLVTLFIITISLICISNTSVFAANITSSISEVNNSANNSASNMLSGGSSTISVNDPTVFNPNAGSNTYTPDDSEQNNQETTKNTANTSTGTNSTTNNTLNNSNYYDQPLVTSTNTITPNSFDVGNLINIILIIIGVLIIVFAGAILIKLRLNQ